MLERTWMACTYRPKVCLQHLHRSELSLKSPVQRAAEKAEKERKKEEVRWREGGERKKEEVR